MHGVATARGTHRGQRRLAARDLAVRRRKLAQRLHGALDLKFVTFDSAGPQFERRALADQFAARIGIGVGKKRLHRHVDEVGIAVIGLPIGEGELHRLDDGVDECRARRTHRAEIEILEERDRLQEDRPLPPGPDLVHAEAMVVVCERRVVARAPVRHVVRIDHAAVAQSALVHHLRAADKPVDRLGDEALVEGLAGGLDLAFAAADPCLPPRAGCASRFRRAADCGRAGAPSGLRRPAGRPRRRSAIRFRRIPSGP